jgi:hypothetical protein
MRASVFVRLGPDALAREQRRARQNRWPVRFLIVMHGGGLSCGAGWLALFLIRLNKTAAANRAET